MGTDHSSVRFVPVSCLIYRSEEAKPCDKWSTYVKIELSETLVDLRKRFAINDYGGFKKKAAEKGAGKLDFQLGVKHKKPDAPDFPNGRLYTANTEEEWFIYKEFLFGVEGKEYELVVEAREVVLQAVASHLKEHEPLQGTNNNKKGSKRGRPKSEKKELDKELFKKLKKGNVDHEDSDIYRHEFQKKQLEDLRKECQDAPLGMESGAISDAHVTASSEWDGNHAAVQGRLNFKAGGWKQGAWSAASNDVNQWLQVDLGKPHTKVTDVATQGRNFSYNQWVTKYKLQYSLDGVNFYYYKDHGQSETKEFVGNTDRDTVVYHKLGNAIRARYIRFRPTAWHSHISMRVEVYGRQECQDAPLGMESGAISDAHVTASSEYDGNHAAVQGRLNFKAGGGKRGAWSAASNDVNQWLQVDLGNPHTKLTGVATQGRNFSYNQWVTKYKLQYSLDGVNFYYYKDHGQSKTKEFVGNTDRDTVVYHKLGNAITARYIRFRPTAWHRHISMRVEVYGCQGVYRKQ